MQILDFKSAQLKPQSGAITDLCVSKSVNKMSQPNSSQTNKITKTDLHTLVEGKKPLIHD